MAERARVVGRHEDAVNVSLLETPAAVRAALVGVDEVRDERWDRRRQRRLAVLAAIMLVFVVAASISDGRLLPDFSAWRASVTLNEGDFSL